MKETFHKRVQRWFHCLTHSVQENSDAAIELCHECFTAHPSRIAVIILHPKAYHFILKPAFAVGQCVNAISWRLVCTGAIWTVALKLKILHFP
jgi:hypothetical protein